MGRDADAQAARHLEWPKRSDGSLETRHALLDLRGMRTEDFLVCNAASAELGESVSHGAGVPGIGNGGDTRGPAFPNALPGRIQELRWRALSLQGPEPANPRGEIGLVELLRESGEFEMSVSIDETGQEGRVGEVLGGDTRRRRDCVTDVRADCGYIPLFIDEDRTIPDRWRDSRENPVRRESPRRHQR